MKEDCFQERVGCAVTACLGRSAGPGRQYDYAHALSAVVSCAVGSLHKVR